MPPRFATTNPEKTYLFIAVGLLLLYVFPYVWLGEGAHLTVHDNLDSDFLYLYLLKLTNTAFDFNLSTVIPNMMSSGPHAATAFGGIPRSAFRTGLNLEVLSFYLAAPYTAHVINLVAVHGIGFLGMYLLLKKYVLPESHWALAQVSVAFLFALVPCYIVHGASVTGQPLLLFAFLNLLNRQGHWSNWLIIVLFPFYSFFVWAGLFICVALGLIGLVAMLRDRQMNWDYLSGLFLLSLLYLASEWELIYGFVNETYISHRVEFNYGQLRSMQLKDSWHRTRNLFLWPMFNTGAFLTRGIFAVAIAGAYQALRKRDFRSAKWLIGLPLLALLICLIHAFYHYVVMWLGDSSLGMKFRVFQFDRFYFLLPTLWFILFGLALRQFEANGRWVKLFLAAQFVTMIVANKEWRINVGKMTGHVTEAEYPSFRAFFAEKQFAQLRNYIGKPQSDYRVICLGMHPSVAQFNGFYTLDSYQNNYPLPYKHAFRKIIAAELAKGTPKMRAYYDAYACRAYLYTAELGLNYLFGKTQHPHLKHLQIDTDALMALGGEYVISAVPIDNAAENRLHLESIFTNTESYWKVWLYKVMPTGVEPQGIMSGTPTRNLSSSLYTRTVD
ncbi:DUF6044 family protein [Spirosoma linguale]|uniref:Glycosyltransferase RgtA/B/C/D-like domain-containing protein n=1 Tax=Spirosoma linguale (strain ATCC 33905 / DSM 74 / LMG 10896 / Claus 1) TaxID=504472 RepID=D2QQR4_SPILD|nr:hypothetical protein Slin_4867 [Spirosoma linguale DSM 74]